MRHEVKLGVKFAIATVEDDKLVMVVKRKQL